MITGRDFIDLNTEYIADDPLDGACPRWVLSLQEGIVCEEDRDIWPLPNVTKPPLFTHGQCQMHTLFWVALLAAVAAWPLIRYPATYSTDQLAASYHRLPAADLYMREIIRREKVVEGEHTRIRPRILRVLTRVNAARKKGVCIKRARFIRILRRMGAAKEKYHRHERSQLQFWRFRILEEDLRRRGTRVKCARLVQILILMLNVYLDERWCGGEGFDRIPLMEGYTKNQVAVLNFSFLLGAQTLPVLWSLLHWKYHRFFRYCVRTLGHYARALEDPEATELLARKVVYLTRFPILGIFLTWPNLGIPPQSGGVWPRLAPSLFLLLSQIEDARTGSNFYDDEVELLYERPDLQIWYRNYYGDMDKVFKYHKEIAKGRNLELGTDSTALSKTLLCRRCRR